MATKNKNMPFRLTVRAVIYKTDNSQWAAHCLETDLVGYGKTPKSSIDNLTELTEMQISFALFKKDFGLLDRPAPSYIFELYYNLQREEMRNLISNRRRQSKDNLIANIPLLPPTKKTDFRVATH
jgi:hypothetical protein